MVEISSMNLTFEGLEGKVEEFLERLIKFCVRIYLKELEFRYLLKWNKMSNYQMKNSSQQQLTRCKRLMSKPFRLLAMGTLSEIARAKIKIKRGKENEGK